jgi:hypothetical protein
MFSSTNSILFHYFSMFVEIQLCVSVDSKKNTPKTPSTITTQVGFLASQRFAAGFEAFLTAYFITSVCAKM